MKRISLATVAILGILGAGCAQPAGEDVTHGGEVTDESELRGESRAAELRSGDGLTVKLQMLDGTKRHTKNRRFIKGRFSRGNKSVTMWCDSLVEAAKNEPVVTKIRCTTGVATVSNDDDESLTFEIVRKGDETKGEIGYFGDGTFLGDQFKVLAGPQASDRHEAALALTVSSNPDSIDKNPLTLVDRVAAASNAMIGKTVHIQDDDVDARVKIKSLTALISDKLVVSFIPRFGGTRDFDAYQNDDVSLLEDAGQLGSGVVSEATLTDRMKAALKVE
jgi:hypothetical protein